MSTTSTKAETGHEASVGAGPVGGGVDGSANAQRALGVAAELARRLDVDLVVLHALGLMTVIEDRHVPSEGHLEDIVRLLSSEWCRPLQRDRSLRWRAEIV